MLCYIVLLLATTWTGLAFTKQQNPCLQTQIIVHIGLDSVTSGSTNNINYNEQNVDGENRTLLKCNDTGYSIRCPNLETALKMNVLSNRCLLLYNDETIESAHDKRHVNNLILSPALSNQTKTLKILFTNDNSSLIFWNCRHIHVMNIDFVQRENIHLPYRALSFNISRNLNISRVSFRNFVGYALSITAEENAGDILLTELIFESNRSREEVCKGMNIETVSNASCTITITNSHFINLTDQRNATVCSENENDDDGDEYQLCGRGAALGILFGDSPMDVKLTLSNQSRFIENHAFIGAGIYVKMPSVVGGGGNITVSGTEFIGNKALFLGGGILFTEPDGRKINAKKSNEKITINFNHLKFFNNTADRGGAMAFWKIGDMVNGSITLKDSIFHRSKASACGADVYSVKSSLSLINVQTTSCECIKESQQKQGFGSVAIYDTVLAVQSVQILNHFGSGIVLDASTLVIDGFLLLKNNTSYLGGGLALFQDSIITLTDKTDLQLEYNHAELNGGGLYISLPFPLASQCFFQNHENFIGSVRFTNNTSPSGNAVYTRSLRGCSSYLFVNRKIFDDVLTGWPHFEISCQGEVNCISTDPSRMEFHPDTRNTIRSGVSHHFNISVTDERGRADMAPLSVKVTSKYNVISFKNNASWSVVSNKSLVLYGPAHVKFNLTIYPSYPSILKLEIINLILVECAWYQHQGKSLACICKPEKPLNELGVQSCSNGNIYLNRNKWVSNSTSKVYDCPLGYCSTNKLENKYDPEKQCHPSRDQKSILCSKCKANYSVVIGDNANCHDCNNRHDTDWVTVLFLVGETLGVDFLIVLLILVLNWNKFAGFLNPIIFSYRLIPSLLRNTNMIHDSYRVTILSLFDRVQNGKSSVGFTCIMSDLNNLQRMWVDFGMAMSWFVTWLLIIFPLYYRFQLISRDVYYRTASVLAMIVYFEFMEFLLRVLHPIKIEIGTENETWRVFEYATEEYFSTQHIFLFIAAVLVCILLAYCLLVSFFEGLPSERGKKKYFDCILPQMLKPFFLYQRNCFKKSKESILVDRSWFLVLRYTLFTVFLALAEYNFSVIRNILMSIVMVVLLWCLLALMPYQNRAFNIFEIIMVANILAIGLLTESISEFYPRYTATLTDLLCYVPLIGLLYWIFQYFVAMLCFNNVRTKIFGKKTREMSKFLL